MKHNHLVLNRQRKHRIDNVQVRRFLSELTDALDVPESSFSVVFVSDGVIRQYNRDHRGFDKPTDVLSFPADRSVIRYEPGNEDDYLGDILISAETAYNQARKSTTLTFDVNVRRLMLHGLLHLMGYDHETDDGEMRTIERRLRRRFQC